MDELKSAVIEFFKKEYNFTFKDEDLIGSKISQYTGFYQKTLSFMEKELKQMFSLLDKSEEEQDDYLNNQKSPLVHKIAISSTSKEVAINTLKRHTTRDWNLFEIDIIIGSPNYYIVYD